MKKNKLILSDQVILITGSQGFIGRKLVSSLKNSNNTLILLEKNISKLEKNKGIYSYKVDFSNDADLQNILSKIKKTFKKIDKIVSLAALTGDSIELYKNKKEIWKEIYNVNLFAPMKIFSNLKTNLKKSKRPSIVIISSIYGEVQPKFEIYKNTKLENFFDYSSSKSGLIYLTKWLAKKYSPHIRVNCISPGGIIRKQSKTFIKNYNSKTLLKRMCTESDVVGPILFLLSEHSSYITGQNLLVDGGFSL